ncbi:bifunctional phosphoribosylaminoimidazolecarboxamide formyltransferase/IMP cyclohydrolase [Candidatus Micrarchaeota archaeon]|nr:bifunctional phosphoribosylaminoimidazolecarboxamide formyltransferase/IMP cyclohydrolase [Candidatus Micrarchaeota archaeon]
MKIKTALVSVSDKKRLIEFARKLREMEIEIISTGGTYEKLTEAGIKVKKVEEITGFPEMMDGRIRTLHPKIHGGILGRRERDKEEMEKYEINGIDLVVVNLYPFEKTIEGEHSLEDAIEKIDIGGPTLIRAAAKNYKDVGVVCDPEDYEGIADEIMEKGELPIETKERLMLKAFEHVAHYDVVIENYFRERFGKEGYPEYLNLSFKKIQDLRYGENSHQSAAFYRDEQTKAPCIGCAEQLNGKQLSYNNILDINGGWKLVTEFEEPTCVIVKHNNPCGVATNEDLLEAYKKALLVDSMSAFGGIVTFNKEVNRDIAEEIVTRFYEVVVAPGFSKEAIEVFKRKKNLRLIKMKGIEKEKEEYCTYRSVKGGLLVQTADDRLFGNEIKVVSKRKPSEKEMENMKYAWTICKHAKSNSIIYARDKRAVGIGAGQMKRVDAAKIGALIAEAYGETIKDCAMASDAFFPFRDGIDEAAKRGVTSVIQPGGSIRDQEVIDAANEHGMAMVFTGIRHFRH